MRRFALLAAVTVLIATQLCAQDAPKRPFTFDDMMTLKRIGGPVVSPNGQWVVFSAVAMDLASNKRFSHLWLIPLAGGDERQVTFDAAGESGPRWSPDGRKLLFISARGGGSQVYTLGFNPETGVAVGTAKQITNISVSYTHLTLPTKRIV